MKNDDTSIGGVRLVSAFIIVALFIWGWNAYVQYKYPPPPPPLTAAPTAVTAPSGAPVVLAPNSAGEQQTVNGATAAAVQAIPAVKFSYKNDTVSFELSSHGMGFESFTLNNYKDKSGKLIEFSNPTVPLFSVLYKGQIVPFDVQKKSETEFEGVAQIMGKKVTRTLKMDPNNGSFYSHIKFDPGLDSLVVRVDEPRLSSESSFFSPSFDHQDFIFIHEGSVATESISSLKPEETFSKLTPNASMGSIVSQYFTLSQIEKSDFLPALRKKVEGPKATLDFEYDLKNIQSTEIKQVIYLGPKKLEVLSSVDSRLDEVMNYGWFGFISKILLKLLKFMFGVFGNWGLAIIGMTLVVRALLLPFNMMSFKSSQALRKIKPQMDKIKELYKDDPVRMNKETFALMKANNVNHFSGCLPMLLQIPIFFALWRAISGSVELYHQPFFSWIQDLSSKDPYFILPLLMGATMYIQQKMTPNTMDPAQQKILNFMPILFTLFMISLPSGLTLYNLVSSVFGITQQFFLLKKMDSKT